VTDTADAITHPCPGCAEAGEVTAACRGCGGTGQVELAEHPAKFTDTILDHGKVLIRLHHGLLPDTEARRQMRRLRLLDTHAGTGKVHVLEAERQGDFPGITTAGIEIEPEWAAYHDRTRVGDAANLPFGPGEFDLIFTSVDYGNRMADHHDPSPEDTSKRYGYRYQLGRMPSPESSCVHKFGKVYRAQHEARHKEAIRVLVPGGLIFYNVSDFLETVRKGEPPTLRKVVNFHVNSLCLLGCSIVGVYPVATPRMGNGANSKVRVPYEHIIVVQTPTTLQGQLL
jgi:SAM-dependent methyltransferase